MESWQQPVAPGEAVLSKFEARVAPGAHAPDGNATAHADAPADAPLTSEEMDAVVDELVAIASRMAAEQAAVWSGRDPRASEDRQLEFARGLLEQEDAIRRNRPEFDLEKTLREQPAFRALIMAGEPVERALGYIEPGEGARRVEMEIMERIRRRGTRPQPIGSANRAPEPTADERLSDEEMGRIDAQLKRGHKVYLNY